MSKIEAIESMLKVEEVDVLGILEADLQTWDPVPNIPEYRSHCEITNNKRRVIVYARSELPIEQNELLETMPAVYLTIGQVAVAFLYNDFTQNGVRLSECERKERLCRTLNRVSKWERQTTAILGDFNVQFDQQSPERTLIQSWAANNGYAMGIEGVTRRGLKYGKVTESNIDQILAKGKVCKFKCADPGLSDHSAISCRITKTATRTSARVITINKVTPEIVCWARENRPVFSNVDSVSKLYERLRDFFKEISARSKITRRVCCRRRPEWYTPELQQMKQMLCILRGEEKKTLRNQYVTALRRAKRDYDRKAIQRSTRGVWQVVKKVNQEEFLEITNSNGRVLRGELAAEKLKEAFMEKSESLRKIPEPAPLKQLFAEHIGNVLPWDIQALTIEELYKVIDSLKAKRSTGPDNISYALIKQFKFEIGPILLEIMNRSIVGGEFLAEWKIGRVVPVYKGKGGRRNASSYRPVTLTSVIGRIVEMAIRLQMKKAFEDRAILSPKQYGFLKGVGTAKCLQDCLDEIRNQRIKGNKVAICALDASGAFDALWRPLVVELLEMTGAGPKMSTWIRGYFSNRKQYVDVGGVTSTLWDVDLGSVQGGPLSGDLYNLMSVTQTLWNKPVASFQYVDDEIECLSGSTVEACSGLAQETADGMVEWFKAAGLTMNPKKTELIGFGFTPEPIIVGGLEVTPVSKIKFLGLQIQSDMRWSSHVEDLCTSIRRAAGRIRVEGRYLNQKERTILYHGWVGGKLHCNARAYMPSLSESEIEKLQTAANAAVRAVGGRPRKGVLDVSKLRRDLRIQSVRDVKRSYEMLEAWERREHFRLECESRERSTRSKTEGRVCAPDQRGHKKYLTSTIAANTWNALPDFVRDTNNKMRAKLEIKKLCSDFE